MAKTDYDVVIIGGGAAGLFCAAEAGKRGRKTLVLEHSPSVGRKIAISGGGRCNFTNAGTTAENFLSANPHFCKSALARYTPDDFIALVEKYEIAYYEKKEGQLFCRESAQQIIQMLLRECSNAGVEVRCGVTVNDLKKTDEFALETSRGPLRSSSLVIATGGLSIPKLGATDFGYRVARKFGLAIEEARPALVPFILSRDLQQELSPLSGISVEANVATDNKQFRDMVLVTHHGLSGPAILQASLYWKERTAVLINLSPTTDIHEWLKEHRHSEVELANLLSELLPRRFAHAWCKLYFPSRPMKQLTEPDLLQIAHKLSNLEITPIGTEGFRKAEVTAGGVSTAELSSQTMEARRVPGLFFIGEVVDVTGQLGGYNFQWAWASAYAAGQCV